MKSSRHYKRRSNHQHDAERAEYGLRQRDRMSDCQHEQIASDVRGDGFREAHQISNSLLNLTA
jgi:hypothetical protein